MIENKEHIDFEGLDKTNPFKAPEGYFDSLTDRIMDKVEEEGRVKPATKVIRLLKPVLAMAASFTLIFMLIYFPVKTWGPNLASNDNEQIDEQILDYYFFSDHEIAASFDDELEETYNDEVIEMVLLASVSDMELYNLEN